MMMDVCPSCPSKLLCDSTHPHPYDNVIWHGCVYKIGEVSKMFAPRPKPSFYRCDICRSVSETLHYQTINGVHVCYDCYKEVNT